MKHHGDVCSRRAKGVALAIVIAASACAAPVATAPPPNVPRTTPVSSSAPPDPVGSVAPGPRACDDDRGCAAGETCFAPDFHPGRGVRPQCEGEGEASCGPGMVCDNESCVPLCTAQSCGAARRCVAGHCRPRRCDEEGMPTCPRNHRCDRTSGSCARIACRASGDCDDGVCWQGTCFAHGGFCMGQGYCCPP